jgi:transcriptional regulator with XRE-family HTH domain
MNQEDFGELLGLSRDQVKRLENGKMEAGISIAVKVEELVGIPVKRLFEAPIPDAELPTFPNETSTSAVAREPDELPEYRKKANPNPDFQELLKLVLEIKETLQQQGKRIAELEKKKGNQ